MRDALIMGARTGHAQMTDVLMSGTLITGTPMSSALMAEGAR